MDPRATATTAPSEPLKLGSRLLYLRTPNFRGKDVEELQTALGALGFACGGVTGIFGAYTEGALRKFQLNMGLEEDGIAGIETYSVLKRLRNAWLDKPQVEERSYMSFARVADVLEQHAVCLFGTEDYTRKVASYMSNLALATNPRSKIVSADTLLVPPSSEMLLARIVLKGAGADAGTPRVVCDDVSSLALRIKTAVDAAKENHEGEAPMRIVIEVLPLPYETEESEADEQAHREAVSLLDAFCTALD